MTARFNKDLKAIALEVEKLKLNQTNEVDSARGVYTIGIKSSPMFVTISSQMNRALVLAEALYEKICKEDEDYKIAIIGGGYSGVMFSQYLAQLSAKKSNIEVTLFEKREMLCPIQRGCHTRRIHPNIHKFPKNEWDRDENDYSEFMYNEEELIFSELSAHQLAKKCAEIAIGTMKYFEKKPNQYQIWQNISSLNITPKCDENELLKYKIVTNGEKVENSSGITEYHNLTKMFDIVIFATGPGVEITEKGFDTKSYWRNDDIGQTQLYKQSEKYIISGDGDGAVTDFLRLMIKDYSQFETVKKFLCKNEVYKIIEESRPFKKYAKENNKNKDNVTPIMESDAEAPDYIGDLYSQYTDDVMTIFDYFYDSVSADENNLKKASLFDFLEDEWTRKTASKPGDGSYSVLELISEKITYYLNRNTECIFHLRKELKPCAETIVNSNKVTLYNRILFYLTWKVSKVRFDNRELTELINFYKIPHEQVIIRHGADKNYSFKEAGLSTYLDENSLKFTKKIEVLRHLAAKDFSLSSDEDLAGIKKHIRKEDMINKKVEAYEKMLRIYQHDCDLKFIQDNEENLSEASNQKIPA